MAFAELYVQRFFLKRTIVDSDECSGLELLEDYVNGVFSTQDKPIRPLLVEHTVAAGMKLSRILFQPEHLCIVYQK